MLKASIVVLMLFSSFNLNVCSDSHFVLKIDPSLFDGC